MDDLDSKAPKSDGIIRESPGICLLRRNRALETGVTVSIILRQTLDIEGARGMRL